MRFPIAIVMFAFLYNIPFRSATLKKSPPSYAASWRSDRRQNLASSQLFSSKIPAKCCCMKKSKGNCSRHLLFRSKTIERSPTHNMHMPETVVRIRTTRWGQIAVSTFPLEEFAYPARLFRIGPYYQVWWDNRC